MNIGMVNLDADLSGDDFFSKMPIQSIQLCRRVAKDLRLLVNQTSRRQLGRKSVTKYFLETSLVVIKELLGFVIHRTDINHDVACI